MASGPITSWQIGGETMETVTDYFLGLQNHYKWWLQPWNKKMLAPWKKSYDQPRQHIKKQRHYFANKGPSSQSYDFSSSHVWTWKLHHKEGWEPKNWCFWIVVLEKTLESPLDCKEMKAVNPKRNQPWIFIGRTDAEALILWLPDAKSQLTGKDPDAGKRLKAKGEGSGRERDGWIASPAQWTRIWVNSGSQWRTRKPGVLLSMDMNWTWLSNWTTTTSNS